MKRTYIYALVIGLFVSACNDTEFVVQNGAVSDQEDIFIPEGAEEGELLIKFVPEMTSILDQIAEEAAENKVLTRSGIPSTDEVLRILGGYELERVFPVDPRHEERARANGMHLWYIVRFNKGTDLKVAIRSLKQLGEVSKIQCNTTLKRVDRRDSKPVAISRERLQSAPSVANASFNDKGLYYQWGYTVKATGEEVVIENSNRRYVLLPHEFDSITYSYWVELLPQKSSYCYSRSYYNPLNDSQIEEPSSSKVIVPSIANSVVPITINNGDENSVYCEVYAISGILVHQKDLGKSSYITYNIESLRKNSLYVVRVKVGNEIFIYKTFVK
jgi:hypothetical protein